MAYKAGLGYYVAGVAKAHAIGDVNTFTVSVGGLVLVTKIWGLVTVAAGGAVNINVGHDPTLGTATTTVWCVTAACGAAGVGDLITLGSVAGTLTTVLNAESALDAQFICAAGSIFVRGSAAQGTSQWFLYYMPLTAGSTIVAIP